MNLVFDWAWLPQLGRGLVLTVELTAACMALGALVGIVLALLRVYARGWLSPLYALASAYVHLFRGTPLLVQLMIVHFGLPNVGIVFTPFVSGLVAMALNTAAYQAEYFRGDPIRQSGADDGRAVGRAHPSPGDPPRHHPPGIAARDPAMVE